MLEGNANITTDKYNSKKAGNADRNFNALAGLRINLGKSHTKTEPVKEHVNKRTKHTEKGCVI